MNCNLSNNHTASGATERNCIDKEAAAALFFDLESLAQSIVKESSGCGCDIILTMLMLAAISYL